MGNTKVVINVSDLKSSISDLENAIGTVTKDNKMVENTKVSKYSALTVDKQVNKAVDALVTCLESEKKLIANYKEEIRAIKKEIKQWNQKTDKIDIKKLKNSAAKALESGNKKEAIKKLNELEKNGKSKLVSKLLKEAGYKAVYKSNAKNVFVIYSLKKKAKKEKQKKDSKKTTSAAIVSSTVEKKSTSKKEAKATNAKVTKKANSKATTVASLKKALKKALKKGNTAAVSAYALLASAIGKKKARAYAKKLGYNVTYKNNKPVSLSKIKEEKATNIKNNGKNQNSSDSKNTATEKPNNITANDSNTDKDVNIDKDNNGNNINNSDNINQDNKNDVVASVDDTSTTPEQPSTSVDNGNNNNTTNNTNNSSNNYTRNETPSGNSGSINSESGVANNDNAAATQDENISNDIPADLEDDFDELPKKENKVTTIDTDTEVEENKKSGGLGVAVPLGLGTIATGAAAVAGVRYIKNRNDSEEYDESEEDYDEDSQYIDSAQYATDDDEYTGPAGSVYTDISEESVDDLYTDKVEEESYIDPEDFEEDSDDDFSNDKAFEEINSNFN